MATITRNVTVYTHTFGRFNQESGIVDDVVTVDTTEKLSARKIAALSSANGSHLSVTSRDEKCEMPLDLFLTISRVYAAGAEGALHHNPDGSYFFAPDEEETPDTDNYNND